MGKKKQVGKVSIPMRLHGEHILHSPMQNQTNSLHAISSILRSISTRLRAYMIMGKKLLSTELSAEIGPIFRPCNLARMPKLLWKDAY